MFGGIAAVGGDGIVLATFSGSVVTFDLDGGRVSAEFTLYPCAPRKVHVSACTVSRDSTLLLGDVLNRRVRRFSARGRQLGLFGRASTPGIEQPDEGAVLDEPCDILEIEGDSGELLVACGGYGLEHGVQRFAADGSYLSTFPPPGREGWLRAQGLALVGDEVWVAETEAGAIRRFTPDGKPLGEVDLHADLRRPFRLASDGFGGVLMLLAPATEEDPERMGVARIRPSGAFEGWAARAGGREGQVYCPFDLAVLPDGRFAVADLPLGKPPDVRVQLFAADGRLLATLVEDGVDLSRVQAAWFETVIAREDQSAWTRYEQARVHHHRGGREAKHLARARELYSAAIDADPAFYLAHLGLATLLAEALDQPAEAERAYLAALRCGGPAGDLKARMAACRRAQGNLDGAIGLLTEALEGDERPEDYHARLEELGSYYLERAGENP